MAKFAFRNNRAAKLTPGQVMQIRTRYEEGLCTQGELAREFQISIVQVGRIVRGEVWQTLPASVASDQQIIESAERMMALQAAEQRRKDGEADRMAEELKGPLDE